METALGLGPLQGCVGVEAVALEAPIERAPAQTENARGCQLVAAGACQHLADPLALEGGKRPILSTRFGCGRFRRGDGRSAAGPQCTSGQLTLRNELAIRQDAGTLDDVTQLTDVPSHARSTSHRSAAGVGPIRRLPIR